MAADEARVEHGSDGKTARIRGRSYLTVELLLLTFSGVLLGGGGLLLAHYGFQHRPEVVMTMVVLVGIAVLLASIGVFVTLLKGFGLADGRYPLALPDGSVRAILALSLLLIFSMLSVFLYWDGAHPQVMNSVGLTADQLAKLPQSSIVALGPGKVDGTFNVSVVVSSPQAQQLGQQLVTILGTLVTAIAAFYFGASSVASEKKSSAESRQAGESPQAGVANGNAPKPNDPGAKAGEAPRTSVTPSP